MKILASDLLITASAGDCFITANGRYLYAPGLCRMINGVLYVPLRPLAKAYGSVVLWLSYTKTVFLFPGSGSIEPGGTFYKESDVYWMSRIISAEARGESMTGKIAVGNVVMNRLRLPAFPDSVYGVIFDRRGAVQFTPAYSGAINAAPGQDCVIAAKLALDGADVVGGSLFFSSSHAGCWAARNRPFVKTIGNHSFYG